MIDIQSDYQEFKKRIEDEFQIGFDCFDNREQIILRKLVDVCLQYKNNPTSLASKGLFKRTVEYSEKWIQGE